MNYIKSVLSETGRICVDELKRIFSDGGVMLLLFGATLIYPLIYSFSYTPEVPRDIPVALVNLDGSKNSRELKRMIDATSEVEINTEPESLESAEQQFYSGAVKGVILIPEHFSEHLLSGEQAHLAVYADASYMMFYKQVYQAALYASGTLGKKVEIKRRMLHGTPEEAAISRANPIDFQSHALYNPLGGYGSYALPAVLVLILQQTLLMGIGMRAGTAREMGAVHYLVPKMASRQGALRILFGKFLAYLLLYIPIGYYLLVLVMRWFSFPQAGEINQLFWLALPLTIAAIMLGILLTNFFKNRENSMIFLLFTSIPLVFLSGFSWPVEAFPPGLQLLGHLFPSTPGIVGFYKISVMGGDFSTIIPEVTELWVMALVFFIINWIVIRIKNRRLADV